MTSYFTYFTVDTPYEQEVIDCLESFRTQGVSISAIPYNNANDWMTNALWRAPDLKRRAADLPNDHICLLDADVRALQYPEKLERFEGDFGCLDRGEHVRPADRFSAGVMIFAPTPLGRAMLDLWAKKCQDDTQPNAVLREQVYIFEAIKELKRSSGLEPVNLGERYNRKIENVKSGDDTVILHDVASRRWLKVIGGVR